MTTTQIQQPEAQRLSLLLATGWTRQKELTQAADELDRLHAENEALRKKPAQLTDAEKHAMWVMATIDQCSHEQCYLRGIADSEAAHGIGAKP